MARREAPRTLQDLIDAAGFPLGHLADRAGIDDKTLRSLRINPPKHPRVATVARLARALGVDPAVVRAAIAASRAAKPD